VVGAAIVAGDLDLAGRLQDLSEQTAAEGAEPWALAMTATRRAVVATYSGQPAIAKQACATATERIPPDFSPSFRAQTGWISAVNSDAPRTEVAAQMEEVVEQARLVRSSFLQSIYTQYLASVRAELGDLTQAMSDAADNLERLLVAHNLGLVTPAVRRAAVILIKAGQPDTAARLLGWVDEQDSRTPATEDLAVEIEILVPQMHEALGPDAADATEAGAALTVEEAIELAISVLRIAADDST
jgi:hypothetical protein